VIREVSILRDFVHPNVVRMLDMHVGGQADYNLIFEFLERDLHSVLKRYRKTGERMPMSQVCSFSKMLLNGIHACHVRLIIHRDLKPQNILLSEDNVLKICDFGLARIFAQPLKHYTVDVITLWYRCPEILLASPNPYGPEVDVWSAGCVIAEMATGEAPFCGQSEIDTIFKIFRLLGTPTEESWPGYQKLDH